MVSRRDFVSRSFSTVRSGWLVTVIDDLARHENLVVVALCLVVAVVVVVVGEEEEEEEEQQQQQQ